MDLDWSTETDAGVTFVRVFLRNPAPVARRARVRNELDGPLLAPRRAGVPERGWDDAGYEAVLSPGERRAVGYACPAPPRDPPVELVADERARSDDGDSDASVDAAIRRLGDARPPRDAVPGVAPGAADGAPADEGPLPPADRGGASTPDEPAANGGDGSRGGRGEASRPPPEAVERWVDATAERIARAERLTDPSVATATEEAAAFGGVDGIEALSARVEADAARLRAFAERASALADRAEGTDVPVAALRRLA